MSATILLVSLAAASLPDQHDLASDLGRIIAEEQLMGVAWVTVDGDADFQTGAVGFRDAQTSEPFSADTRVHMGSVTKTLLATGVLRLATLGELDLDAPAARYLKGLSFNNPWADTSPVTVRHLLDHTSGLDDARLWQMFSKRPSPDTPLLDAFPDPETSLRIRSRPGSRFSYSNTGYALLGLVIESVSGMRYEAYLDQYLLAPLGMKNSTFGFTTQLGDNADPSLAWGHVDDGSRVAASPVFLRPAAQFTTTMADLGRFAGFLLGNGTVKGRAFIDRELVRARGRPGGTEAAEAGLQAGYALGLGRRDRHGVVGFCHSGNIVGFVAMLCIYPDEGGAFAYSVNTDSETADYGRIAGLMVSALSLSEAVSPPAVAMPPELGAWRGLYVPSPNRFDMFEYLDIVFGALWLSARSDGLVLNGIQSPPRFLQPVGGHLLSASDRKTASHVLLRDSSDNYVFSDGFTTFRRVPAAFLVAHWLSVALGFLGISWTLAAGAVVAIRKPREIHRHAIAPAFLGLVLPVLTVPLFLSQSFMALGDLTVASAALAVATLLLPIGMLVTLLRLVLASDRTPASVAHGVAAFCVLQWSVVLAIHGLLPLRLWG